ncbi:hypothetical protein TVAG_141180 [Trichomonas vaginalis G3]|uniref:Uncharacterized protein n=1 Tax=Trichomonas vaginalis (strain ATCC PRA-98 / G3) TaxID=412133 RepID=A2G0L1_TRIV3|nr:RelA-associated inhibitor family [Trichomonas vaginalis G3]EAX89303.1 hypothetical protein TVAG_141180 [Trichomonas vaginalis G3]KAI5496506.1 RelA-associated inhibitor family [Trichomonas vaginalis G3]|eukprot:XP_001302233.1 hypothetical protein [Trichomonas vaginalis G3]
MQGYASLDPADLLKNQELIQQIQDPKDLLMIAKKRNLNAKEAIFILNECKKRYDVHVNFDIYRHMSIDFQGNVEDILDFISCSHKCLRNRPIRPIFETIVSISDQNNQYSDEIEKLKRKISSMKKHMSQKNEKLKQLRQESTSDENSYSHNAAEIQKYQIDIGMRDQEIQKLQKELQEKDEIIKQKQKELKSKQQIIQQKDEELASKDQIINQKNNEIQAKNEEIEKLKLEIENLKAESQPGRNICIEQLQKCSLTKEDGKTIYNILEKALSQNNVDAVKFAVENKYTDVIYEGNNMIMAAAEANNFNLVKFLYSGGAQIKNTSKVGGYTILHKFCQVNNVDGVKFALDFIDINDHNNFDKWTPLHVAARWSCKEVCEFLLSNSKIDKNPLSVRDKTPLDLAKMMDNKQIETLLIDNGCK